MQRRFRSTTQLGCAILGTNFQRRRSPYKVLLSLTDRCNLRCAACNIWQLPAGREMDAGEWERFFAANPGLTWISMTGGEIFLRRDLVQIVESLVRHCPGLYLLNFPTNGWFTEITRRSVEAFHRLGVRKTICSVSVDGPEELHDQVRGRQGSWRRALETYRMLREQPGVEAYLGMTVSRFNQDKFQETLEAAAAVVPGIGGGDLHLNLAHRADYYNNPEMPLPDEQAVRATIAASLEARGRPRSVVAFLERAYLRRIAPYMATGHSPVPCQAMTSSAYVGADGTVYPCAMWGKSVGRLQDFDYSFERLWESPRRARLRRLVDRHLCPGCWTPCEAYQSIWADLLRPIR